MSDNTSTDVLDQLGRATAGLNFDELPEEVVYRAKQRILDTVGCLVAGYDAGIATAIRDYVRSQGGKPEVTLLPDGDKTTIGLACLAFATYIHGLELSDAAPRGTAHPGNEVVPVALSYAERNGQGGRDIIPAVVAGYEMEIRFGRSIFPSAFYRGYWTPGMLGPIGAAATAGRMLGLDAAGHRNNLGIVVNLLPTGTIRSNEEGENVKWLIGGHACSTGILSAEMAARDVRGMHDVIGGWMPMLADKIHASRLTEGITSDGRFEQWELLSGVVTKHYATVGPLTSALDATFDLIAEHGITTDLVTDIDVECMKRTAVFSARHPENEVTARASLPYCLAVALVTRDAASLLGSAFRPEMLHNKAIHDLCDKVRITENDSFEAQYPAKSLARVTLTLADGRKVSQIVDRSERGRYLHPTDADIEGKFRMVAGPILGSGRTNRVISLVKEIDTLENIGELIEALRQRP